VALSSAAAAAAIDDAAEPAWDRTEHENNLNNLTAHHCCQ